MTTGEIIFITWIVTAIATVPIVSYLYAQDKISQYDAPIYLIGGIFPIFGVIFLIMTVLDKYVNYINRIRDENIHKREILRFEAKQIKKPQDRNFIAEATQEVDDLLKQPNNESET